MALQINLSIPHALFTVWLIPPRVWSTKRVGPRSPSCESRLGSSMAKVMLCDFWGWITKRIQLLPLLSVSPLSLICDACLWNPATMLWGSPGHLEKPCDGVPPSEAQTLNRDKPFLYHALCIPYPQKPREIIRDYCCFKSQHFGGKFLCSDGLLK